ncbi:TonB-dependent receptor [Chitinophaga sp.]|uniref:TonB-dependent receptor n=1 Tax=Chitinophaga sp. TaxID=1869181 RepID=UPI002F93DD58
MRISSLLVAMLVTTAATLKAAVAEGQKLKEMKLSMKADHESLLMVLRKIESTTSVRFVYNAAKVNGDQLVSIALDNVSLEEALNNLLSAKNYGWKEKGGNIIIFSNAADTVRLHGRVLNRAEPPVGLPGVTVAIKGTTTGLTTDADGYFEITAKRNAVLVFSFIGYKPQEYIVTGEQRNLTVSLTENVSALNEVVVTGFTEQKVKHLASSVSTINMNNANGKPVTQLSQALQGGATGIFVTQRSGLPGDDAAAIKIRGLGTFLGGGPLVLVDGVPFDMNLLDPNTVESITVLKDAAAASLYGARAGNGVIIITTKRGVAGKPVVQYNAYAGAQTPSYMPDFVDAATYMRMMNEANENQNPGSEPRFSDDAIRKTASHEDPINYPDTRWSDEVIRKSAAIQEHFLSVAGGNSTARFAITGNYLSQQGMIENAGFQRASLRANTSMDLRKNIVIFTDMFINRNQRRDTYSGNNQILSWMYTAPPTVIPKFPAKEDRPGYTYYGLYGQSWNPVANLEQGGYKEFLSDEALLNLRPKWTIIPGLDLKGQFSYRVSNSVESRNRETYVFFDYKTEDQIGANFSQDKSAVTNNRNGYYYLGGNLDYVKNFGKHRLNAIAGYSQELNNYGPMTEVSLRSVFAKGYYSYDNKYLMEVGFRRDGSSLFAEGHKWGYFPSIAAGWNLAEEKFMKQFRFLNQFKLRASYGMLGNNNIGPYLYQSTVDNGNGKESANGNPDITWEKMAITDIGTNISLFNSKLDITADWYNKKTTDMILYPQPSLTSGLLKGPANVGSMVNKGWEVMVTYKGNIAPKASFGISVGGSYNKSKILKLSQPRIIEGDYIYREGGEMGEFFGFKSKGLLQEADIQKGVPTMSGQKAGDISYVDIDGDGAITDADKTTLGFTDPHLTYFTNLTLSVKNFDLEVLLTGVGSVYLKYTGRIAIPFNTGVEGGTPQTYQLDYWTPTNTTARFPRLIPSPGNNVQTSDFWQENAAFARIRYISLGYAVPLRTGRIKKLRCYVNAQNPFTFSRIKVLDPESKGNETTYPIMRTFIFGVNVSF